MSKTDRLKQLLIERSVQKGNFVLASGRSSTFYVDARLTTMSPEGMVAIGALALEKFDVLGWKPESVGGLTLGADPIPFVASLFENRLNNTVPETSSKVRSDQAIRSWLSKT